MTQPNYSELLPKLSQQSLDRLLSNLTRYGNRPSDLHKKALQQLCGLIIAKTFGFANGRHAVPLGCGLGKTQSIVAVVATLNEAGLLGSGLSIAVCQSTVEALCELKRELIKNGVPESLIGLQHSYTFNPAIAAPYLDGTDSDLPKKHSSEPATEDNDLRPLLLCTHSKIRGRSRSGLEAFYFFKEKPRSLLIWDESMLVSESKGVSLRSLGADVDDVPNRKARLSKTDEEALAYVQNAVDLFRKSLDRQRDGSPAEAINLPRLPEYKLQAFCKTFSWERWDAAQEFLQICQNELRVVNSHGKDGVVHYKVVVPESLKNVLILDASHTIRELVALDKTIKTVPGFPENIVTYDVVVNQLFWNSGRGTLSEDALRGGKVIKEVVEVIKTIPENEGVILFVFKPKRFGETRRWVNFQGKIEEQLGRAGINPGAMLDVNGEKRPRFVFIHHGNETGFSKFSYCKNVMFVGVLHRDDIDIAACLVGQSLSLTRNVLGDEIGRVSRSETTYGIHQGINRSSCRIIEGDTSRHAEVWMIYDNFEIQGTLASVMPGIMFRAWEPHFIETKKSRALVLRIAEELRRMSAAKVFEISSRKLKESLSIAKTEAAERQFTRALSRALDLSPGWILDKRSVRMLSAEDFGFKAEAVAA